MKRKLYLMRHGQTVFNAVDKAQGWCDSPLTAEGLEQTYTAAQFLKELQLPFDYFCCSSSERATDTLEIIMQELYGELRPYDRFKGLKERFYGTYEAIDTAIMRPLLARDVDCCVPFGGEPEAECRKRMYDVLQQAMQADGHSCVLAISHMLSSLVFADTIQPGLLNELMDEFNNCAFLIFDFDTDTSEFSFLEMVRTNTGKAL